MWEPDEKIKLQLSWNWHNSVSNAPFRGSVKEVWQVAKPPTFIWWIWRDPKGKNIQKLLVCDWKRPAASTSPYLPSEMWSRSWSHPYISMTQRASDTISRSSVSLFHLICFYLFCVSVSDCMSSRYLLGPNLTTAKWVVDWVGTHPLKNAGSCGQRRDESTPCAVPRL